MLHKLKAPPPILASSNSSVELGVLWPCSRSLSCHLFRPPSNGPPSLCLWRQRRTRSQDNKHMGRRVARARGDNTERRMQPRPSGRNVVHLQSVAAQTQRQWVLRGQRPRLPPGRQTRSFLLHFLSMRR